MNDQELKDLWRKQKMGAAPPSDARTQVDAMRKKMAQLHGTLKARDLRELVVAALVVIIFTVYLFKFPYPLTRVGSLIVIGGALFAAWKMIEGRRRVPQPDAGVPVAHWLKQERDRVHHEAELLRTVLWWYILPLCLGPVVFFWGLPHVTLTSKIGYAGVTALMGAVIYWMNQWARRKQLLPVKDELEALLQQESPSGK